MRAASLFAAFITGTIFTSFIVAAWTGPTAPPPSGNIAPPLNAGDVDQIKDAGLGVNSLAVFGNAILFGASRYLNFGTIPGTSGYGIRDNAGTMEFKNSGGTWSNFVSSTNVQSITFADGTTQTTAAGSANGTYQVFTSSGVWTKPPTGTVAYVRCWGGGQGGGRGVINQSAGTYYGTGVGGDGGSYNEAWLPFSSLAATETVTVGAGGAPISGANTEGNPGSDTTFGSHLTAYGGGPSAQEGGTTGYAGMYAGGTGQLATGDNATWGGGGGGGAQTSSTAGGLSVHGGRGGGGTSTSGQSGQNGEAPGGGGGATRNGTSGRGGDGQCIVTTF